MRNKRFPEITTTFIDILTDYGFKLIFGTEKHKEILIRFLNALFENEMHIKEVKFHDKEVLPKNEEGKRVIFDVYCTTDTGHHFIVEMQQEYGHTFEKRIIHYVATGIVDQTRRGGTYDFEPVYTIIFTDFQMKQLPLKMVSEVVFMERESHKVLSDDVRLYFLSLPQVKKGWRECENELERMLYIIKNMDKMDKNSDAYKGKQYSEIFDASEIASMASEDVVAYSQSLYRKNDIMDAIEYASQESYNRGISKGIEKGIEEERIRFIRIMDKMGISPEQIAKSYNVSEEEIHKILNG